MSGYFVNRPFLDILAADIYIHLLSINMSKVDQILGEDKFSGPVHTYPDKFENGQIFIRLQVPSTRERRFHASKTDKFENTLQSG